MPTVRAAFACSPECGRSRSAAIVRLLDVSWEWSCGALSGFSALSPEMRAMCLTPAVLSAIEHVVCHSSEGDTVEWAMRLLCNIVGKDKSEDSTIVSVVPPTLGATLVRKTWSTENKTVARWILTGMCTLLSDAPAIRPAFVTEDFRRMIVEVVCPEKANDDVLEWLGGVVSNAFERQTPEQQFLSTPEVADALVRAISLCRAELPLHWILSAICALCLDNLPVQKMIGFDERFFPALVEATQYVRQDEGAMWLVAGVCSVAYGVDTVEIKRKYARPDVREWLEKMRAFVGVEPSDGGEEEKGAEADSSSDSEEVKDADTDSSSDSESIDGAADGKDSDAASEHAAEADAEPRAAESTDVASGAAPSDKPASEAGAAEREGDAGGAAAVQAASTGEPAVVAAGAEGTAEDGGAGESGKAKPKSEGKKQPTDAERDVYFWASCAMLNITSGLERSDPGRAVYPEGLVAQLFDEVVAVLGEDSGRIGAFGQLVSQGARGSEESRAVWTSAAARERLLHFARTLDDDHARRHLAKACEVLDLELPACEKPKEDKGAKAEGAEAAD